MAVVLFGRRGGRRVSRRQRRKMEAQQDYQEPMQEQPIQQEYQQAEMMGSLRSRTMKKIKNLDPRVKKQVIALMASPLPPLTKRLLIARLIKRNKPMNIKKILKGMAIATSFGAGAGIATGILAKRLIEKRRAAKAAEDEQNRSEAPLNSNSKDASSSSSINSVQNNSGTSSGNGSVNQTNEDDQTDTGATTEEGNPVTTGDVNTVQNVVDKKKKTMLIVLGVAGVAGIGYLMSKKKRK